jgi:hypothetical protein
MPEFVLNDNHRAKRGHAYHELSDFAKGYVEAMFFTNGDTGDDNEHLLNDLGTERLTRAAVASIAKDCDLFLGSIRQWLDEVEANVNYDEAQAGRDLWFTRQGHGVGYWDRDELKKASRTALTMAAKAIGEAYVEVSRGWIYHR